MWATHREQLLAIRRGELGFEEVQNLALELNGALQAAYVTTDLPDRPDVRGADEFLLEARRHRARRAS